LLVHNYIDFYNYERIRYDFAVSAEAGGFQEFRLYIGQVRQYQHNVDFVGQMFFDHILVKFVYQRGKVKR